jgi:hypothetical protein
VGNVVEVLDIGEESDEEEDGAAKDVNAGRKGKFLMLRERERAVLFSTVCIAHTYTFATDSCC